MWTSTRATVGVVTKLVDMHATLGRCIMATNVVGNSSRSGFRGLLEVDGAANLGIAAEDCN